jgi:hypothetical protein
VPLEAVRRALSGAVQVSDLWHLWHGLAEAVQKEVAAHSACWAAAPLQAGKRTEAKLERWQQIHDLLSKGTGPRECARLWVPETLSLPLNWYFLLGESRASSASGCGVAVRYGTLGTRVTTTRLPGGAAGVRLARPAGPL